MPVNIPITVDAATAAKAVEAFSKTAAAGFVAVEAAGTEAVTSLKAVEVASQRVAVGNQRLSVTAAQAVAGVKAMTGSLDANTASLVRQAIANNNVFVAGGKNADGFAEKILSNNRKLKSAIGGIALNATLFAGPQAAQFIYPLVLMQKELKGLQSAAALAGLTLPGVGVAVAGVSALVAIGVQGWKAYKAELEAVAAKQRLVAQEMALAKLNSGLLDKNAVLDRLPKSEADALKARLAAATDEGFREEKINTGRKILVQTGSGQFGGAYEYRDVIETKRIETERRDEVLKIVQARLREVNLTEEQLQQMTELRDKTEQLHVATMEGFDKERAAEVERFRLETRSIEERTKFAKTIDQPALQLARMSNELLHRKTMAKIEKDEWDDKVKKALELQKIQDEAALAEWDHRQRLKREQRDEAIHRIDTNPLGTDAERFRAINATGLSLDETERYTGMVNPDDFGRNMSAQFDALLNQIGTFSQASAGLIRSGLVTALDGVSDSIINIFDRTKTMGQIWQGVLRQMLAQSVQFSVQQLAAFVINTAKRVTLHTTAEGTMTAATVAGSQIRGTQEKKEGLVAGFNYAVKAAKSVADIPYVGWLLAAGVFAAVMGTVAAASVVGGFDKGGYTGDGGRLDVAGLVHRGEVVWSQDDVARVGGVRNAEMLRRTGGVSAAAPAGSSRINQTINAFFDKGAFLQAMRDDITAIALDAVRGNKVELGFPT